MGNESSRELSEDDIECLEKATELDRTKILEGWETFIVILAPSFLAQLITISDWLFFLFYLEFNVFSRWRWEPWPWDGKASGAAGKSH